MVARKPHRDNYIVYKTSVMVTSMVIYRFIGGLVTKVNSYVLAVIQGVKVKKKIEHHNGLRTPLARTPPWCLAT